MDTMGPLVLCLVLLCYQANATFQGGWESDVTHLAKAYGALSHVLPIYSDKRNEHSTVGRVIPLKEYIDVLKNIPVFRNVPYIKKFPVWQNIPFVREDHSHSRQIGVHKQIPTVRHTPILEHVSVIQKVPLKLLHNFDDTSHSYSLSKHFRTFQTQAKDKEYIHGGGITTESGTGKLPYGIAHGVQFDDDTLDHTPATEFRSAEVFNKEEIGPGHLLEIEPKSEIGSIEHFKQSDIGSNADYGTISPIILNKKYASSKGFRYRYPISNYPYNYGKYSASYRSLHNNKKNCGQAWIPLNKHGLRTYSSSYLSNTNGQYNRLVGSYHELTNPGYKLHEEYAQHNFPEVDDIRSVDPHSISHHNKLSNSYIKHKVIAKEFHNDGDDHPLRYNHNTDLSSEEYDDDSDDDTSHEYQGDHLTDDNDDTILVEERENVHSHQHRFLDKGHLIHKHEDSHLKDDHEDGHVIHKIEDKHAVSEHPVDHHLIHEVKGKHLVPEHQADHHLFHDFEDKQVVPERPVDHHLIHDFKNKDKHVVPQHPVDHHLIHNFKSKDKNVISEHPVHHHLIQDFKGEHAISEHPVDHHPIHDLKSKHHNNHKQYYEDLAHEHKDYNHNDQRSHFHTHDHAGNNFDEKGHPSGYEQSEHELHSHDNHRNYKPQNEDQSHGSHEIKHPEPTPSHSSANQPAHQQYEEQKQIDNNYDNQHDKGKNLQNNHKQLYEETDKDNYEQKLEKPDRSHNQGYQDRGERKQHGTSTKGRILYWYFRKYHGKRFGNQEKSKVAEAPQAPYSKKTYEEKVRVPRVNDRIPENYNVPQLREGHKDPSTNYGDRLKLKEYKKPALTTSNQHEFNLYQYENENEKTNPKYDTKIDLSSSDAPKQSYRPQFSTYNTDNTPQRHKTRVSNYGNNHGASKTGGIQSQYFRKYHQGVGSRNYGGEYSTQRNPHNQNAGNYRIQPQLSSQNGKQPSSLYSNIQPGYRQFFETPNSEQYSTTSQTGGYKADKGFPQQSKSSSYGRDYSDTQKIRQNNYKSTGQFRPINTDAKAYGKDSSESSVGNKRGVQENYFRKYHRGLGAPIHGGHIKPMTSRGETSHNLQNNFMTQLPLSILKKIPKSYTPTEQKKYDEDDDKYNNEDLSYSNEPLTKTGYETNQQDSPHQRKHYQDSHPQNGHKLKQQNQYMYPVSPPVQEKYDDLDSGEFDSNGSSQERGLISNYFRKYHLGLGAHIHGGNYGDSGDLKTSSNARKKA